MLKRCPHRTAACTSAVLRANMSSAGARWMRLFMGAAAAANPLLAGCRTFAPVACKHLRHKTLPFTLSINQQPSLVRRTRQQSDQLAASGIPAAGAGIPALAKPKARVQCICNYF